MNDPALEPAGRAQAERLAAEAITDALRRREEQFRLIVNAVPVLIAYYDARAVCRFSNRTANLWFGFSPRESRGRTLQEIWGPAAAAVVSFARRALAGEEVRYELWSPGPSGEKRFLDCALVPHRTADGAVAGFVSVCIDDTERKNAELQLEGAHADLERRVRERTDQLTKTIKALQDQITERQRTESELVSSRGQLRALSSRLESAREQERTHLSRKVHDELGQMMTALMVEISWLKKRPRPAPGIQERLNKMTRMVDETITVIRRIATDLRPGALDDLGLVAAVEWQLQEFQENTKIKTSLTVEPDGLELDNVRSTCIFRIIQEALTNIVRHAKAGRVAVVLRQEEDGVFLEVSDNGRGITEAEAASPTAIGLIGIRERALICGGQTVIRGAPGKGTVLQVRLPHN